MNNYCQPISCEDFEMLLSCCLDGEISADEQEQLIPHLAICDSCRERKNQFESINRAVYQLGEPTENRFITKRIGPSGVEPLPARDSILSYSRQRLGYATLAATAVIVLLTLNVNDFFAPRANANELAGPMAALVEINSERIRDQEFLRETLELDLRTLKLELAIVGQQNSADLILGRIEKLMERLVRFESAELN